MPGAFDTTGMAQALAKEVEPMEIYLAFERAGMIGADREGGLVASLQELSMAEKWCDDAMVGFKAEVVAREGDLASAKAEVAQLKEHLNVVQQQEIAHRVEVEAAQRAQESAKTAKANMQSELDGMKAQLEAAQRELGSYKDRLKVAEKAQSERLSQEEQAQSERSKQSAWGEGGKSNQSLRMEAERDALKGKLNAANREIEKQREQLQQAHAEAARAQKSTAAAEEALQEAQREAAQRKEDEQKQEEHEEEEDEKEDVEEENEEEEEEKEEEEEEEKEEEEKAEEEHKHDAPEPHEEPAAPEAAPTREPPAVEAVSEPQAAATAVTSATTLEAAPEAPASQQLAEPAAATTATESSKAVRKKREKAGEAECLREEQRAANTVPKAIESPTLAAEAHRGEEACTGRPQASAAGRKSRGGGASMRSRSGAGADTAAASRDLSVPDEVGSSETTVEPPGASAPGPATSGTATQQQHPAKEQRHRGKANSGHGVRKGAGKAGGREGHAATEGRANSGAVPAAPMGAAAQRFSSLKQSVQGVTIVTWAFAAVVTMQVALLASWYIKL